MSKFAYVGRELIEGGQNLFGLRALALDESIQLFGLFLQRDVGDHLLVDGVEPHVEVWRRRCQLRGKTWRHKGIAGWGGWIGAWLIVIHSTLALAALPLPLHAEADHFHPCTTEALGLGREERHQ